MIIIIIIIIVIIISAITIRNDLCIKIEFQLLGSRERTAVTDETRC
jgi:hypothetical protein